MASVLLVEDEELLRRNLTRYLARRGYTVAEADNVATAIEALEAFAAPFDVILLDINLPDGTGWDVLRYLREQAGESPSSSVARQPRVIVITAVRPAQCRLDEFRLAALLLKPFPMDALMRLLDRVLARRPHAETMDTDGQESGPLSARQRRGGDVQEGPAAAISRDGMGSPRAGDMSAVQTQNQPVYERDMPRDDVELDVEDAFSDHDIEYWVRKGNKLVPATDDEIAQIREWGRESSALVRLALWKHMQVRSRSGFARLLRGFMWVEQRLGLSRQPLGAGHEPEQRQRPHVEARGREQHATERAT